MTSPFIIQSMRIFTIFAIVWAGLAAYPDLNALDPEGPSNLFVPLSVAAGYAYAVSDTWLLHTSLYVSAATLFFYAILTLGAPIALLALLVFAGMAAYQS